MALTKIDDRGLKTPIDLLDSEKIRLGTGNDLELYHDGSNGWLKNGTNTLILGSDLLELKNGAGTEAYLKGTANGATELFHDNSRRLHTAAEGIKVFGPVDNNCDVILWADNGTDWTDGVRLRVADAGPFTISGYNNSGTAETFIEANINGSVELYYDNSLKFQTKSWGAYLYGDLCFTDNNKVVLGTGDDLQIYHDGSNSYIKDAGTGSLIVLTNHFNVANAAGDEEIIKAYENGAVELYYDGVKTFATTNGGAHMGDSKILYMGAGNDLQIYHDGTNSQIQNSTGQIRTNSNWRWNDSNKAIFGYGDDFQFWHDGSNSYITNTTGVINLQAKQTENSIILNPDGAVELYYNNSKKFETTDTGAKVLSTAHDSGLEILAANNNQETRLHLQGKSSGGTAHDWILGASRSSDKFFITNGSTTCLAIHDSTVVQVMSERLTLGTSITGGGANDGNFVVEFSSETRNAVKLRDTYNTGSTTYMVLVGGSATVGSITGTTGAASFNNLSDYRSKENDVEITDGITKLKLLRPIRFNYKTDSSTLYDGFFAHEVTPAVPTAVTGVKDAVDSEGKIDPQMLDASKLVPLLTAALQEAITKIETLETKVAALEAA